MSEIVRETTVALNGPWLLAKEDLEQLESTLDAEFLRLKAIQEKELERVVRREQREFKRSMRRWTHLQNLSPEEKKKKLSEIRAKTQDRYPFNVQSRTLEIQTRSGRRI